MSARSNVSPKIAGTCCRVDGDFICVAEDGQLRRYLRRVMLSHSTGTGIVGLTYSLRLYAKDCYASKDETTVLSQHSEWQ